MTMIARKHHPPIVFGTSYNQPYRGERASLEYYSVKMPLRAILSYRGRNAGEA
jgi:hypothetical protein